MSGLATGVAPEPVADGVIPAVCCDDAAVDPAVVILAGGTADVVAPKLFAVAAAPDASLVD